jgi:hypothetical protein
MMPLAFCCGNRSNLTNLCRIKIRLDKELVLREPVFRE